MITTYETICDVFSFLDKDQIERVQLVNQFWNNVAIRHKNILPLRLFAILKFISKNICLRTKLDNESGLDSYIMEFVGTNLSQVKKKVKSRYRKLTVDEVLKNLNDVVFEFIEIQYYEFGLDCLFNRMKLVTTKTGGRFRGRYGQCFSGEFGSELEKIFSKGFLNTVR